MLVGAIDEGQALYLKPNSGNQNQIYACAIPSSAYFTRVDGSPYSREDYYATPERYRSVFAHLVSLSRDTMSRLTFNR